ncbi:MATE family efflux transporter [Marivibrio halodurans]|uniref:MATE family efflux transporter n=1 Tax=Marivibrio halodurans TaxID=2039722 RepID=A0A8J7V2J0_9PROT|nr:MATE family efflux transporter [Marivibrio halodurans]MBP5857216.1 MATE family efflux transporter [Marivibrio halodurans]
MPNGFLTLTGPWDRRVWRLAGPIILSNLTVPLLGAVDTAVVGHLPDPAYLGAVALGATIFSFVYWGFGFLRMSTTGLTAQAWGAGDGAEVTASLFRAGAIALAIAGALILLQMPIGWFAFRIVESSPQVEALGRSYFDIRIWGAPANLINYVLVGWFLGRQDARTPLILMTVTNAINVAFDFLFVVGFGWAVAGVAGATVIAEWSGALLGLFLVWRRLDPGAFTAARSRIVDRLAARRLFAVNRDIFIRTLCLVSAMAYFTMRGAGMGELTLAANAVLLNFLTITSFGLDGFAHAAEALIGDALGRRDRGVFDAAARAAFKWAAIIAVGAALVFILGGEAIVALLTDLPEVRAAAAEYLPWPALLPLVSVWCFTYDGIFLGATRAGDLRNGMLVSLAGYLAAVHLAQPAFGNHGLWFAMIVFMGLRGVTLACLYPRLRRSVAAG